MLLSRVVEAVARELGGIALPGGDEVIARCRAGAKGSLFRHLPFLPLPAYSAATAAVAVLAWMSLCIRSAASRPSRIPHTTSQAPRTTSPAAHPPASGVLSVLKSVSTVPERVTPRPSVSKSRGSNHGAK